MNQEKENNWHIKSRYLIFIFILSLIISFLIWTNIDPDYYTKNVSPLSEVLFDYFWYFIFFSLIHLLVKKASINWKSLFGDFSKEYFSSKYILIVIPLIAVSLFGVYLIYYPLSFNFPNLVKQYLIESDVKVVWLKGNGYKLATVLSYIDVAILTPIIEEIFFRGLLLTSLANKWNMKKAIILSSIIFGIFHADIIGATIFGIVLSIIYIKTKSLFAPIILHAVNNTIAFILAYFFIVFQNNQQYTLKSFQNDVWFGIIGLIISLPWFIYFIRKENPSKFSKLPYYQNARV